jgi:hypothetical protein
MSKPRRSSRRAATDRSATVDIVSQLECAIRYPQATLIGALVGGLVPWFARTLAHEQLPATWNSNHGLALAMLAVVIGCGVFSGLTVYKFGRATFGDKRKAIGFTLALEGVMLVSTGATSAVALAVLILINALGNGSNIALARQATCKQREALARATATRRSRATAARTPVATVPAVEVEAPEVVTHARRRSTRTSANDQALVRWTPPAEHNTVIDAEIVSEDLLLS